MTDEQIKQSIAEVCGWKETSPWINGDRCFERKDDPCGYRHWDIPNYCTDLNAMHEAEKVLNANQWYEYALNLNEVCWHWALIHAPARQRAEALLRTLGKWEEVRND